MINQKVSRAKLIVLKSNVLFVLSPNVDLQRYLNKAIFKSLTTEIRRIILNSPSLEGVGVEEKKLSLSVHENYPLLVDKIGENEIFEGYFLSDDKRPSQFIQSSSSSNILTSEFTLKRNPTASEWFDVYAHSSSRSRNIECLTKVSKFNGSAEELEEEKLRLASEHLFWGKNNMIVDVTKFYVGNLPV